MTNKTTANLVAAAKARIERLTAERATAELEGQQVLLVALREPIELAIHDGEGYAH